ncbi:hypothetical protein GTQ34_01625 [Muricauda sp. JGD-17]|uniref:Lipoprotein n=1 Tax=Flagellimonas ochracea TaxID=2696472 RepID=A0A964T996_9FLAO|nr:hypothetical protein [Allomuricauda ochracea]NAY90605.1 hypothetical protein [Allomuricauda ochracea]
MRITILVFAAFFLLQSCQVYKPREISEMKNGKTYELTLYNGQTVEGICSKTTEDNIYLKTNENIVTFPKEKVSSLKRRKTNFLALAGGITLVTAGTIFLINDSKEEAIPFQIAD